MSKPCYARTISASYRCPVPERHPLQFRPFEIVSNYQSQNLVFVGCSYSLHYGFKTVKKSRLWYLEVVSKRRLSDLRALKLRV